MKIFNPLVFVLVFLCQVAMAQNPAVKATIKGPSTALAGTLVFLSSEDAVGDNKVWMIPDELKSQSASCGSNIFFSIPTPGKYQFGLIVSDKTAAIDYKFHTIEVVGTQQNKPTPGPTPVPVPVPTPVPNFDGIRVVSRTGIDNLADPSTTQSLQTNLIKTLNNLPASLPEAKSAVSATIEFTFANREVSSLNKDWLNKWRIPVDKEIGKLNPKDVGAYRECMKAAVRGLCVNGVCPNIP